MEVETQAIIQIYCRKCKTSHYVDVSWPYCPKITKPMITLYRQKGGE